MKAIAPYSTAVARPGRLAFVSVALFLGAAAAAQTNTALRFRALDRAILPTAVSVRTLATNATTSAARVEFRLPQRLEKYHVVEQTARSSRVATNVASVSANDVRATLAPGSTLLFVEKEAGKLPAVSDRTAVKPLFSTLLVKALPPAQPGGAPRAVSGTLAVLADTPTRWNDASNAYVARLSVMLVSEDTSTNHPLLPLTVEFQGTELDHIVPRKVELRRPNPDGSQEVFATCGQYRTGVLVTAYYWMTNTTRELTLRPMGMLDMTQMIASKPMLFASLTGGLMGGLLRLFKSRKWKAARTIRYLLEGATVGLVTVTFLLSGLLHGQIAGLPSQPRLVLAFALAAAAGSVGAHFLDQAIGRLRKKPAE